MAQQREKIHAEYTTSSLQELSTGCRTAVHCRESSAGQCWTGAATRHSMLAAQQCISTGCMVSTAQRVGWYATAVGAISTDSSSFDKLTSTACSVQQVTFRRFPDHAPAQTHLYMCLRGSHRCDMKRRLGL